MPKSMKKLLKPKKIKVSLSISELSLASAENQGNTSFTDKGKDKIVAYNSESDSEEGDPRFRVGSRFSSYQNQSNKEESKRIESQRTPIEKIAECTKE